VTLLREDASGEPYERPRGRSEEDRFLQIPSTFWTEGYDERIDVPGLALFLALAREKPWTSLPAERADKWYGWSADTHSRGLHKLIELGLAERRPRYEKAPLSPVGYTLRYEYQLVPEMRPRSSRARTDAVSEATPASQGHAALSGTR
jgi:hypothetical protein